MREEVCGVRYTDSYRGRCGPGDLFNLPQYDAPLKPNQILPLTNNEPYLKKGWISISAGAIFIPGSLFLSVLGINIASLEIGWHLTRQRLAELSVEISPLN